MLSFAILSTFAASICASPLFSRRSVDNTQSAGTNSISVSSVQFLGVQTSENSCSQRDLGFTGRIGDNWYAVYGDTLWCSSALTEPSKSVGFPGMVRDSVALMTDDVLKPRDLHLNSDAPVPHQLQFIPFNAAWGESQSTGFGGTSLCHTSDTTAVVFYVVVRIDYFMATLHRS